MGWAQYWWAGVCTAVCCPCYGCLLLLAASVSSFREQLDTQGHALQSLALAENPCGQSTSWLLSVVASQVIAGKVTR
jgi:hypothetical protein